MRVIRLKAHLFGNSKESQSKLAKAINRQARYKGGEAVNLELNFNSLAAVVMHPPATQKTEDNLPLLFGVNC